MNILTKQQRKVLDFVKQDTKKNGMPPTRREISTSFGWASVNAAHQHLMALERKGYIKLLNGGKSRGIVVLK